MINTITFIRFTGKRYWLRKSICKCLYLKFWEWWRTLFYSFWDWVCAFEGFVRRRRSGGRGISWWLSGSITVYYYWTHEFRKWNRTSNLVAVLFNRNRFFYHHLWWPWVDDENDMDINNKSIDWVRDHLEHRLRLWVISTLDCVISILITPALY